MEFFEFSDEFFIDFLATCGVEDEDSSVLDFGPFEGVFGDFDEIFFPSFWLVDWDVYLCC